MRAPQGEKRARTTLGQRGYTIIEIVMSLGILAVGVSGVIAMQKVTVTANQHAKNLSTATHIAQSWLAILEAEAVSWSSVTAILPTTDWHSVGLGELNWFRPVYNEDRDFGPAFDAVGNPLATTANARFCADIRIEPLVSSSVTPLPKSGLVRIEARVVWIRDQTILGGTPKTACGITATNLSSAAGISEMNFVHMTSAIRSIRR